MTGMAPSLISFANFPAMNGRALADQKAAYIVVRSRDLPPINQRRPNNYSRVKPTFIVT